MRDVDLRVWGRCVVSRARRWRTTRVDLSTRPRTSSPTAIKGQIRSARGMPFLATASPSFSALTTCCGLAGATGVTNAVLPESIISGRSQRMISLQKLFEGCGSAMEVFVCPLFQQHGSPLACKGCESVLASVLLHASWRNFSRARVQCSTRDTPRLANGSFVAHPTGAARLHAAAARHGH